jgi:hypothetical protein
MQSFFEALFEDNGFTCDPVNGFFAFTFGSDNAYSLTLEYLAGDRFYLALYEKRLLLLPAKIPVRMGYTIPKGPGTEQAARRQAIREQLQAVIAQLDEADRAAQESKASNGRT